MSAPRWVARAGGLDADAVRILRGCSDARITLPYDHPDQVWTHCPACDGPIELGPGLASGCPRCSPEAIEAALERSASQGTTTSVGATTPPSVEIPCEDTHARPCEGPAAPGPCDVPSIDPALDRYGRDPKAIERYARSLGVVGDAWEQQPCLLPDHSGCCTAAFFMDKVTGAGRYGCRDTGEVLTIPELEATIRAGKRIVIRTKVLASVWYRAAWHRPDLVTPAPVELPELPATATPHAQRVRNGLTELFGLRWIDHHGQPSAASHRFLMSWCSLTEWEAREGLRENLGAGTIHDAGERPTGGGYRPTRLVLPGPDPSTDDTETGGER